MKIEIELNIGQILTLKSKILKDKYLSVEVVKIIKGVDNLHVFRVLQKDEPLALEDNKKKHKKARKHIWSTEKTWEIDCTSL